VVLVHEKNINAVFTEEVFQLQLLATNTICIAASLSPYCSRPGLGLAKNNITVLRTACERDSPVVRHKDAESRRLGSCTQAALEKLSRRSAIPLSGD
jgi:hypothetical protein